MSRNDKHSKKNSFIEYGLTQAEISICAFENIEGVEKVNSEVSAFQR